ncbi:MAG: heme-binding protein [Alphaproteobacteria bacterium]|nr:heme-binding protein [Alphaproteobacteria bacterium]
MTKLTLAQASAIISGALAEAATLKCRPLTVAVLDDGGHVKALHRQDGSEHLRPRIAEGKAWGALGMGRSSRKIGEQAREHLPFFTGLVGASDGRTISSAGGVIFTDGAGVVLGAVGISGDTSDRDEACALAGIAAAGLKVAPDP